MRIKLFYMKITLQCFLLLCVFETGSYYVALHGLELYVNQANP